MAGHRAEVASLQVPLLHGCEVDFVSATQRTAAPVRATILPPCDKAAVEEAGGYLPIMVWPGAPLAMAASRAKQVPAS